jgi:hypothetical protein
MKPATPDELRAIAAELQQQGIMPSLEELLRVIAEVRREYQSPRH